MDAQPELSLVAKAMNRHGLEGLLIGNMGAALHGAPVSTIDIDFFFRKTPRNMQRLKAVAQELAATILRPLLLTGLRPMRAFAVGRNRCRLADKR